MAITKEPRTKNEPSVVRSTCSGCGAAIIWIQMGPRKDGTPGGTMPVDPEWRRGDGRKHLVVPRKDGRGGKLLSKPGPEWLGREPHWGTCPARKRFKR